MKLAKLKEPGSFRLAFAPIVVPWEVNELIPLTSLEGAWNLIFRFDDMQIDLNELAEDFNADTD